MRSAQRQRQQCLVVPDDKARPPAERGCPELAGTPQQKLEQLLVRWPLRRQVKAEDARPSGDEQLGRDLEQGEGSWAGDRFFGRALHDAVGDVVLLEKLSGALAALSAGAVVAPC